MTTTVREQPLGFRILARIREAMEFRCFTVEDLAGATGIQATLLRRRFIEPGRLYCTRWRRSQRRARSLCSSCSTRRRATCKSVDVKPNSAPTR